MGKKNLIKSLGKVIANISVHEILFRYTNKPESINFLASEISEYRDTASQIASEYNWNSSDLLQIKEIAIKNITKTMSENYPDVIFPKEEISKIIKKAIKDVLDFGE